MVLSVRNRKGLDEEASDYEISPESEYFRRTKEHPLLDKQAELDLAGRIKRGTIYRRIERNGMVLSVKRGSSETADELHIINYPYDFQRGIDEIVEDMKKFGIFNSITSQAGDGGRCAIMKLSRGASASLDTLEKIVHLRCRTKDAEEARQLMTGSNYGLVVEIAKLYLGHGLPLLDLVQEGNLGLMRAVDMFEPERGCRFSTYATWWIRERVSRAVYSEAPLKVPPNIVSTAFTLQKKARKNGISFLDECVLEGISEEVAETLKRALNAKSALSLSYETEQESPLYEIIPDEKACLPDESPETIERENREEADKILSMVKDERQKNVLYIRYMLACSLKETGRMLGIGKERARQIEKEAISNLKRRLKVAV